MNCVDCHDPLQHGERQVHCRRCNQILHRECAMEDDYGFLFDEKCYQRRQVELKKATGGGKNYAN